MTTAISTRDFIETDPEDVGMASAGLERTTRVVRSYVDEGKFPGAISMVARRGKVVHCEVFGRSDVETGRPLTLDTIFRFYSMTKPIVGVALMTLYEEGRFQLDEPVSNYIPELKNLKVLAGGTVDAPVVREPAREMTARDLLTHTSGLVGTGDGNVVASLYERAGIRGSSSDGTLADMIAKLKDLPLRFDPGAEWNYGISTDVVGYLCEVLSGQPLDRFLQERIFAPLGMVDTGFHVPAQSLDRFAANYRRGADGQPVLTTIDRPDSNSIYTSPRTYFSGAGGLVSTAGDYMRFCKMLANGGELEGARILGPRTLEFMTLNHLPGGKDLAAMGQPRFSETTMEGIGFGLGFAVLLDPATAHVVGTPGEYYWGGAASTAFFVNPREELIMLFLTQLMPSSSYPIRRQLRQTIYASLVD